jgi:hypothetical protein
VLDVQHLFKKLPLSSLVLCLRPLETVLGSSQEISSSWQRYCRWGCYVIVSFVLGTSRMNLTKAHSKLHSKTNYKLTVGSTQPRVDQNILHFGGRGCVDLRDQVYALLSISRTDRPITADYRISNNGELYAIVLDSIEWDTETSLMDLDKHLRKFLRISDHDECAMRAFNQAILSFRQVNIYSH